MSRLARVLAIVSLLVAAPATAMEMRQQSTASYHLLLHAVQSADNVSALTGATLTCTCSRNAAAFASCSGAVSEISSGWYKLAGHATDTGTLGTLAIHCTATSMDPIDMTILIVAFDPFVANLQADVRQLLGTAWATPATAGLTDVNVKQISTDATAADNAELFLDGTGYAGTNNVIPVCTAVTNDVGITQAGADKAWGTTTREPTGFTAAAKAQIEAEVDDSIGGGTGTALTAIPWNAAWDTEVESEVDDSLGAGTGTSLIAIPWNAAWDAEVQSEATDSLNAYDPPTFTELDARTDALDAAALAIDDFIDTEVAAIKAKTDGLPSDPADESNLTALLNAIDDFLDTEVAAIKAKTDNLPSDPADESNLTALLNAIDDFVDTEVAATLAAVDTEVGAIKAKTDNLPSDPADESNLTALLNAIDDFVDTEVAAIKAKTDGLPSDPADESNLTALLTAIDDFVDTEVAAVKVTTDHLETALELDGAVYRYTINALEQAPSGAGAADPTVLQTTTIATLASQVSFTLTAGSADNSAYRDCLAIVTDSATAVQKAFGVVSAYTGATKTVTLAADPAIFTMAVGDAISLIAPSGDWDIAIANHLTAGTTGAKLNSAASAGDPLATPVPGAYAAGTAGYVLGNITATLSASGVSVSSPLDVLSQALEITVGDEYTVANGLAPTWNLSGAPSLTGTTVEFRAVRPDGGFYTEMATVVDSDTLRIELVAAETGDVTKLGVPTTWSYHLRILTPFVLTVVQGELQVFTTPTP